VATRAEVLASARWKARQQAIETDALTPPQWMHCLARAWRRLWLAHPEAFHVNGELTGVLPEMPRADTDTLPMDDTWIDVLAIGCAADALSGLAIDDPERAAAVNGLTQGLDARFALGAG